MKNDRGRLLLRITRSNTISLFKNHCPVSAGNYAFNFLPPSFFPLLLNSPHPSSPLFTQAALMGGTTMVLALVLPEQHCSLLDAYEKCRALADAKACCDYALHVGVTWWGPKVRTKGL